jgi:hypothetical protein
MATTAASMGMKIQNNTNIGSGSGSDSGSGQIDLNLTRNGWFSPAVSSARDEPAPTRSRGVTPDRDTLSGAPAGKETDEKADEGSSEPLRQSAEASKWKIPDGMIDPTLKDGDVTVAEGNAAKEGKGIITTGDGKEADNGESKDESPGGASSERGHHKRRSA